jgi:hypothetical protein
VSQLSRSVRLRIGAGVVVCVIWAAFAYEAYEVYRPTFGGWDRARYSLRKSLVPARSDAAVGWDWTLIDLAPAGDVPGTGTRRPRRAGGANAAPSRDHRDSVLVGGASSAFVLRVVERMEPGVTYEFSVDAIPEGAGGPDARIYLARTIREADAPLTGLLAEAIAGPWALERFEDHFLVPTSVRYTAEIGDAGRPLFAHLESTAGRPDDAVAWKSEYLLAFPPIDSQAVREARMRIIWRGGVSTLQEVAIGAPLLSPVIAQLVVLILLVRTRHRNVLPAGAGIKLLFVLALAVAPIQELLAWGAVSAEEWQGDRGPGYWRYVWTSTRALVWLPWGLAASLLIGAAVVAGPRWRRSRLVAGVLAARAAATATFIIPALVLRIDSEFVDMGQSFLFVLPAAAATNDLLFARRLMASPGPDSTGSIGLRAWALAWLVTLGTQLVRAWDAYEQLSPHPPDGDCFVVTAAAQGHPRVVASFLDSNGKRVNAQLETLRRLEARLRRSEPALHQVLRAVYNRVGPIAAARLNRPWRADLAYLTLKPIEWLARRSE